MELALSYSRDKTPVLIITYGVSGSGKSFLSSRLVESMGAVQIRTDVESAFFCIVFDWYISTV